MSAVNGSKQDDGIFYFDQASELLDSTSELEKRRCVDLYGTGELVAVGDYMAERREKWLAFISHIADQVTCVGWGPNGHDIAVPLVAGSICDFCERSRRDLGVFTLQVCSVCRLAFYCSAECQIKAWKEQGHKKVCRKKGEFKEGDLAFILGPVGNISSGEEVRIMAPAPNFDDDSTEGNSNQHWVVKSEDDDGNVAVVSAGRLKRIRPARWNVWGRAELDNVADLFLLRRQDVDILSESEEEAFLPDLVNSDPHSDDES
jgi:hypothetical protein